MRVSKLEIFGFRGIQRGEFMFHELTTLIGPNNAGKTTITEALALVLGRDRLVRPLTEHDFHGSTPRSEEHTSELQSLMRISYAVFCLKKKNNTKQQSPKLR